MKPVLAREEGNTKAYTLVLDAKDDVGAAVLKAIGTLSGGTAGYLDPEDKDCWKIPVEQQVEMLSLVGGTTGEQEGEPKVRARVVLGRADGATRGAHLLEPYLRRTLKSVSVETPARLRCTWNEEVGLAIISSGN